VLVLGGGDGLALREVLRYPDVRAATLVELDPAVIRLARNDSRLRELNHDAFADPRVRLVNADAFTWLRHAPGRFDAVIVDLPDPDETATAKLYSTEFYSLVRSALAPGGRVVVQAGSPYFAATSFWCIEATLRAAGLTPTAYHVDVPSFGDWGFLLTGGTPALPPDVPPLRFLTPEVLRAATVFPADRAPLKVQASTLLEPRILQYARDEWRGY
jgi:spermidine synthase